MPSTLKIPIRDLSVNSAAAKKQSNGAVTIDGNRPRSESWGLTITKRTILPVLPNRFNIFGGWHIVGHGDKWCAYKFGVRIRSNSESHIKDMIIQKNTDDRRPLFPHLTRFSKPAALARASQRHEPTRHTPDASETRRDTRPSRREPATDAPNAPARQEQPMSHIQGCFITVLAAVVALALLIVLIISLPNGE